MFGPSIFSVFRSRWKALWWAGSILLLAYCTVPSPEESAQQGQPNAGDLKAVQDAIKSSQMNAGE